MDIPAQRTAESALHALVVDDDPEVRELLAEHLRSRGCQVAMAGDGTAALHAIARGASPFGLVFCDLHLPGVGGLAVLEAARAASTSTCVVIITGYASLDSAIQAVRLGAYDYLTKPFSLGQIDVILARVAERSALEAENRRLLHRLDTQDVSHPHRVPGAHTVAERLAQIEARLAAIESAIRDLADGRGRMR
jgi:two-component system response regulator AtoC